MFAYSVKALKSAIRSTPVLFLLYLELQSNAKSALSSSRISTWVALFSMIGINYDVWIYIDSFFFGVHDLIIILPTDWFLLGVSPVMEPARSRR